MRFKLVTTHTLFLYHVNSYESGNFSKSEAKACMYLAKFFTLMTCKLWEIEVPEKVREIVEHEGDELHKTFEHDELALGFKFMADMINRLLFLIVVIAEIVAFSATVVTSLVNTIQDRGKLDALFGLEEAFVKLN